MFADFQDVETASTFSCDLCIVGAGAAGITMALRLADKGLSVCLIESGGFEYEEATQALYAAEMLGVPMQGPSGCRLRFFGGTTNHWAGWCTPLAAGDFETRDWVAHSGWPLSRSELDPYYDAAQEIFELGPYRHEAGEPPTDADALPFDPKLLHIRCWQYSPPTRFGARYRDALAASGNVQVVLHANVVGIRTNATATAVEAVQLRTLAGRSGSVRAKAFVLACGALENARLLLQTRDVDPAGLGNESGALGRFFMQHPEPSVADIVTDDPEPLAAAFGRQTSSIGPIRPHLTVAAESQRRFGLLNAGFDLDPQRAYGAGYMALRGIANDIDHGKWPANLDARLWSVLADLDGVAEDFYRRARGREVASVELSVHAEQAPNPDSRVTLSGERDALGMPKLCIDWRLTIGDKRSIRESTLRVGEELTRLKLGRIRLHDWLLVDDNTWPEVLWSGCHHMGTTRMTDDPATGVVDRNCRLHGVGNLYVAGSSVFPTGGYATPTFTIVALALRLADHLEGVLV